MTTHPKDTPATSDPTPTTASTIPRNDGSGERNQDSGVYVNPNAEDWKTAEASGGADQAVEFVVNDPAIIAKIVSGAIEADQAVRLLRSLCENDDRIQFSAIRENYAAICSHIKLAAEQAAELLEDNAQALATIGQLTAADRYDELRQRVKELGGDIQFALDVLKLNDRESAIITLKESLNKSRGGEKSS